MVSASATLRPASPPRPSITARATLRLGLFGCPLDTGNRGVDALCLSTLHGLASTGADLDVLLFDSGSGDRELELAGFGKATRVTRVGCFHSRRYYRRDNLIQMYTAACAGMRSAQPMLRRLGRLDAILDVSGGDSFSDIYGPWRFRAVTLPKLIALRIGVPLILLPQTYGPYASTTARRTAQRIVRAARQVWARDEHSFGVARSLAGEAASASQLARGVDVAFGLPAEPAGGEVQELVETVRCSGDLVVGLNVSGLLYNRDERGSSFGLRGSYRSFIGRLLEKLLARDGVQVLLIPHVATTKSSDCDVSAMASIIAGSDDPARRRLHALPMMGASEMKWLVGRCDWFCGTRMHACIAALSQGVPTTGVAYSDKMRGVFESAGAADAVVDVRKIGMDEALERVLDGLDMRSQLRRDLEIALPPVRQRWAQQFEQIAEVLKR